MILVQLRGSDSFNGINLFEFEVEIQVEAKLTEKLQFKLDLNICDQYVSHPRVYLFPDWRPDEGPIVIIALTKTLLSGTATKDVEPQMKTLLI